MRFFRASAWASSGILFALWAGMGTSIFGAELPSFTVDPSTVTAGKTLTFLCRSKKSMREARIKVGDTETRFYKVHRGVWLARLGIEATEPAGLHTAHFSVPAGSGTFCSELNFHVREGRYPVSEISLKPEKDALFKNGSVERDAKRLASFYARTGSPKKLWNGSFQWPVTGIISSEFGARRSYGGRPVAGYHSGVDLANTLGTPVRAPAPGRVVFAEGLESFGQVVLLDHGQGVFTYYLHMSSSTVGTDQFVKPGAVLGLMGQEGVATGSHVHWSLAVAGIRVDPLEWVERAVP